MLISQPISPEMNVRFGLPIGDGFEDFTHINKVVAGIYRIGDLAFQCGDAFGQNHAFGLIAVIQALKGGFIRSEPFAEVFEHPTAIFANEVEEKMAARVNEFQDGPAVFDRHSDRWRLERSLLHP